MSCVRKEYTLVLKALKAFIKLESSAGLLLFFMAILALWIDNSSWAPLYESLLKVPIGVHVGTYALQKPLLLWINDFLISIFFLLIGLEIKREMMVGYLHTKSHVLLPAFSAVGGMVVPALIYAWFNHHNPIALRGWGIPVATDIAFALGVLGLLVRRVPLSLKIFLMSLAIYDDLGAILVIALFYAEGLHWLMLCGGMGCLLLLLLLNRFRVQLLWPYLFFGLVMWLFMLHSGVHPTLAGIALALTIPLRAPKGRLSPAGYLEKKLLPWVAWFILPLFAFANSGVSFHEVSWAQLWHPIPLGIMVGLLLGKPMGIMLTAWLAVRTRVVSLPEGVHWMNLLGVACICGIGFTMSLFIGTLAFDETQAFADVYVRCGVLTGSFLSGLIGYAILRLGCPPYQTMHPNHKE